MSGDRVNFVACDCRKCERAGWRGILIDVAIASVVASITYALAVGLACL